MRSPVLQDSAAISITGLGSLAGYASLWFTVKSAMSLSDARATLQVRLNASGADDGLIILNGVASDSPTSASIEIDDPDNGDITIYVDASVTRDISDFVYYQDVQSLISDDVSTRSQGRLRVMSDVTRDVS